MSDLGKNLDEQTYHARADRRYTQGQVIAVDTVSYTCTVDVGAVDVAGTPVYLHDVPYQSQTPPEVTDTVSLVYANASPQSVAVSATARGGQTAGSAGLVEGVVTSLAASGRAALQGPVLIGAGNGVTVSEAGQTITVANAGVLSLNGDVGALTLAAGSNVTITPSGGNTLTIAASGGGGGSSPLMTKGDLWGYDTANNRIPIGANGTVLTADSTQSLGLKWAAVVAAGVSSLNSLTGALSIVAGSNVTVTPSGEYDHDCIEWGGSYYFDLVVGSTGFNVLNTDTVTFAAGSGLTVAQSSVSGGVTVTYSNAGVLSLNSLTGALSVAAGTGIGVAASGSSVTVTNNGVTSLGGATGALTLAAGTGITVSGLTITNAGVTSLNGSTGALNAVSSLNGLTGALSVVAGSNVSSVAAAGSSVTVNVAANRLLAANTSIPGGNTISNTSSLSYFASNYSISSPTAGTVYRVTLGGVFSTDSTTPGTVQLALYLGTTKICGWQSALSWSASSSNSFWSATMIVTICATGSSGSVVATGLSQFATNSKTLGAAAATTVNTTSSLTLQAGITMSSGLSTNTITLQQLVVELLE